MLRRLSKLGFFIQFLLFIVIAAVLWIPGFIHPLVPLRLSAEGPLYIILAEWISSFPLLSVILAFLITVFLSLSLYFIGSVNDLLPRENFLVSIFFVFLLSWNKVLLILNPLLPAGLLILLGIYTLMRMYGQQEPYKQVFTATACIGIASMFYLPSVYVLVMVWLSFVSYRIATWREWIIAFIGFLLPFIYLISWYYWNDELKQGTVLIINSIQNPGIAIHKIRAFEGAWIIVTLIMLLTTSVAVINAIQDRLISIRRKSFIMINYMVACIFMVALSGSPVSISLQLFFAPFAFFMATSLSYLKRVKFLEIMIMLYMMFLVLIRIFL